MLKLYSPQGHYKTHKILIAAGFANVELEHIATDYKQGKNKQFLKKYPNSSLPALEVSGQFLFGTSTALRYIADIGHNNLRLTGEHDQSLVDQWLDFTDYQIDKYAAILYLIVFGLVEYDEQKYKTNKKNLFTALKLAENHLKTRTFLVCDQITVADISLASNLVFAYKLILDKKVQKDFTNLTRWFTHISSLPPFSFVFGKMHFCEIQYIYTIHKKQ